MVNEEKLPTDSGSSAAVPASGTEPPNETGLKKEMVPKPKCVEEEPCISPADQAKLAGTDGPKKRGRPPKNAAAKQKAAKAKARPQAKAKAKAKAQAKAKAKAKEAKAKEAKAKEAKAKEAKGKPKAKAKTNKSKANKSSASAADEPDAKQAKTSGSAEPTAAEPAVADIKPSMPEQTAEATAKKQEAKQRNARKSKAYRRAFKAAQDKGLSEEECAAAGRNAPLLSFDPLHLRIVLRYLQGPFWYHSRLL